MTAAAHLVVVGGGRSSRVLSKSQRQATASACARSRGDQRDVVPWLQALDVFALPSFANEGVPQALIQAMLAGLAVRHDQRRR